MEYIKQVGNKLLNLTSFVRRHLDQVINYLNSNHIIVTVKSIVDTLWNQYKDSLLQPNKIDKKEVKVNVTMIINSNIKSGKIVQLGNDVVQKNVEDLYLYRCKSHDVNGQLLDIQTSRNLKKKKKRKERVKSKILISCCEKKSSAMPLTPSPTVSSGSSLQPAATPSCIQVLVLPQ
ncbi:scm-like with four MBT domains protein 1 X2 [Biomphalaria glabrata]|nr:Biomphalaria glabrata scm-like with four MBT domains protein 1; transcript variant X2 [Biomphalaria glabrata]